MRQLVMAIVLGWTALAMAADRPNVIFIMVDDLGYGDLGSFGQKVIQTPNIDRLAVEGTRYTDFYAGSTVCAPSRCCLMTGLHTGHAYVRGNKRVPLRPEDVTVAEVFKQAGYATGIIGKWGLGEPETSGVPNRQGFDTWFGYLNQKNAHNYYPPYLWENETKYELAGNRDGAKGQYSHDLFTERALNFLDQHKDGPFFLYLAYTIPHANNELTRTSPDHNGMEVPDLGIYADKDWPKPEKGKAAMISRMDGDVGRLMERLKKLGIDEKTLVFFTSDNGPHREGGVDPDFFHSRGPLQGIKRDLYEGGIRVPMIVRWPGKVKAGATSDQLWAMWDFLPTMADLIEVKPPARLDGVSQMPGLLGKTQKRADFLYWEFHEHRFAQAVRLGDWKAVRNDVGKKLELYNLKNDIGEQHDVAAEHPQIVARIEDYLKNAARTDSEFFPVEQKAAPKKGK